MHLVQGARASSIIYSILMSLYHNRPWLMPANICPIVPIIFLKAGVPFRFVDISDTSLHIDLDQVADYVRTRKFGGLLYAHTYGEASTPTEFFSTIKNIAPEFFIIDDRCLCIPDLAADVHNTADIQLYSTGYAKVVELNFGGYAFLNDRVDYQPVHLPYNLRHHEIIERSYKDAINKQEKFVYQDNNWLETEADMPSWMDYRQKIEKNLGPSLEHRELLNSVYAQRLPKEIQLPHRYQTWRFNIRLNNKQHFLNEIFSSGLFASSHYASLAGIMDDSQAPRAENLASHVINLFNDHHFEASQAEKLCKIISEKFS